jgi:hypothetical protein
MENLQEPMSTEKNQPVENNPQEETVSQQKLILTAEKASEEVQEMQTTDEILSEDRQEPIPETVSTEDQPEEESPQPGENEAEQTETPQEDTPADETVQPEEPQASEETEIEPEAELQASEEPEVEPETEPEASGETEIEAEEETPDTPEEPSTLHSAAIETESSEQQKNEDEDEETEISDDFFDHLSREEVVSTLEEIVRENDVVKIKKQVSLLKIRFLQLNKEYKEQQLQSFLNNGGNKEDFEYVVDDFEERFNESFNCYRANKARYSEELEQSKMANLAKKQVLLEELKTIIDSSTDSLKQIYDRFKDIQAAWKEIGPVPQANVAELWQNYHFYVERFFDKIKINRELRDLDFKKNLEKKLEICEKTEVLLLETSIVKSFKLLQQYHKEWKEAGPVDEDKKDELWNRFKTASDRINQNRRDYYERLDLQQEENYKAKLALCEKMYEISATELTDVKQVNMLGDRTADLFKTWKTIGAAPKAVQDEVWERFRKSLDLFHSNRRQYLSKVREEQLDNYNRKLNLCIEAEAVALRRDWKKATAEMLALQKEWKQIGHVSRKYSEVLWTRFRKACDEYFAAKTEYFDNIQVHEVENLRKKEELIQKVNDYVFTDSKEENFEVLKGFQREWTQIGYTAVSEKERLWEAFRTAIDKRFEELRATVEQMDAQKYTDKINAMRVQNGKTDAIRKEERFLQNKIKQLTDDINLWENNLGFFAHSKNSEELNAQFGKKIEQAKQEIDTLKAKLALINEVKKKK